MRKPSIPGRLRVARLLVALVVAVTACETPPPKTSLNYTADAKKSYEDAMEEFSAHNWIQSQ
ncbi:MAG: hypothetical protein ABI183_02920, partial [Polyangiaceae bacterium]